MERTVELNDVGIIGVIAEYYHISKERVELIVMPESDDRMVKARMTFPENDWSDKLWLDYFEKDIKKKEQR